MCPNLPLVLFLVSSISPVLSTATTPCSNNSSSPPVALTTVLVNSTITESDSALVHQPHKRRIRIPTRLKVFLASLKVIPFIFMLIKKAEAPHHKAALSEHTLIACKYGSKDNSLDDVSKILMGGEDSRQVSFSSHIRRWIATTMWWNDHCECVAPLM